MHLTPGRILLSILIFTAGCSPKYLKYIDSYKTNLANAAPDYSNLCYWAAHPSKKDPSDSIPAPLLREYAPDSTVDVFFLHPTTFTKMEDTGWNASINDARLNAYTDYTTILFQASVFNEFRVFAPRYRQAHIRAYYTSDTAQALQAFDLAYQDIKRSFQYYLDHYNNGRPIVIASHSQGSNHAQRLLKEFFENGTLKNRLVVAYVVGMYIPSNYSASLHMCSDSLQTGCICGWRTYKEGYEPDFVKKEKGTGLITNPLTWNNSETVADRSLNKGAVLLQFNTVRTNVTGAQIHDGVLWINRLHMPGGFLIRRKNFHIGDINIFYLNVREDIKRRVRMFWKQ